MTDTQPTLGRRALLAGAAALVGTTALNLGGSGPAHAAGDLGQPAVPGGPGSVSGSPRLPAHFSRTFKSQYVYAGGLRHHVVVGGDGPPLLLVHGWPQTWYAWRLVMPALARDFRIIAVDQRGIGLSDKPQGGYDTGTLANDLIALMDELGHHRFAVVGHDTGMPIGYALAADHPDRIERLAVAEAALPTMAQKPVILGSTMDNNRLWHISFNRVNTLNEQLVRGREGTYFGWQFATKAAKPLPDYAVKHYIQSLACDSNALRGSFGWYRALDTTVVQNQERMNRPLDLPVLAIGGATSGGTGIADAMKLVANDVQGVVIPGTGHWVAEESPSDVLAALGPFLTPYRAR